jgi:hypothetical protein
MALVKWTCPECGRECRVFVMSPKPNLCHSCDDFRFRLASVFAIAFAGLALFVASSSFEVIVSAVAALAYPIHVREAWKTIKTTKEEEFLDVLQS